MSPLHQVMLLVPCRATRGEAVPGTRMPEQGARAWQAGSGPVIAFPCHAALPSLGQRQGAKRWWRILPAKSADHENAKPWIVLSVSSCSRLLTGTWSPCGRQVAYSRVADGRGTANRGDGAQFVEAEGSVVSLRRVALWCGVDLFVRGIC